MQRIRIKCLPGSSFKLSGSHFKKNIKKIKKVVDIFCPLLYTNSCVTERTQTNPSGCGSAWLERLVWDQEVAGSNPVTPTTCGCSSMVEHQPSKLDTWVRFPSPAFFMLYFRFIWRLLSNRMATNNEPCHLSGVFTNFM